MTSNQQYDPSLVSPRQEAFGFSAPQTIGSPARYNASMLGPASGGLPASLPMPSLTSQERALEEALQSGAAGSSAAPPAGYTHTYTGFGGPAEEEEAAPEEPAGGGVDFTLEDFTGALRDTESELHAAMYAVVAHAVQETVNAAMVPFMERVYNALTRVVSDVTHVNQRLGDALAAAGARVAHTPARTHVRATTALAGQATMPAAGGSGAAAAATAPTGEAATMAAPVTRTVGNVGLSTFFSSPPGSSSAAPKAARK